MPANALLSTAPVANVVEVISQIAKVAELIVPAARAEGILTPPNAFPFIETILASIVFAETAQLPTLVQH